MQNGCDNFHRGVRQGKNTVTKPINYKCIYNIDITSRYIPLNIDKTWLQQKEYLLTLAFKMTKLGVTCALDKIRLRVYFHYTKIKNETVPKKPNIPLIQQDLYSLLNKQSKVTEHSIFLVTPYKKVSLFIANAYLTVR